MEKEIFKTINGYPNYKISNYGTIISLKYNHTKKEKILKPFKDYKGYLRIRLWNKNQDKCFRIHRLVGLNFISNPENKPQINHIDV